LVIYHLKGQHFPASARYKGALHFTARDITVERPWLTEERRAEVADYDNATLYNDSVVAAIAARYAQAPTVMLYFSDHGEDCWDLAPMAARNKQMPDDPAWVERQFSVPFFVWMSPEFMERYPQLVQRLRGAAGKPFSLGDLGQMVLGLCGVETPYYDPALDPLHD
ncbi:MAG: sulfatase-like hydrolase/transferase, partial [Paramuribaculum sp.]|nr:sulfatase-like hydrolase/transferase [Paramuribaculum sp.]